MSFPDESPVAVLVSGGLDSAVLVAEALRRSPAVHPLYVRTGLAWENHELAFLNRFLAAVKTPALRELHVLDLPVGDLYGEHWSLSGEGVPDANSEDEAVFLPGRNVLLLAKAMLWCHLRQVPTLALGILHANPFPDATPHFFCAYQDAVNEAVGGRVRVLRPYSGLTKAEVIRRADGVPLELTLSCLRPIQGRHCGRCNKCAERRRAFRAAGRADVTAYDQESACSE
ncbi:MAG: 7-cyano-7-deazaguanine synthase [Gemmataceae bacterium]|nr:7-cyano-7-deazaguanine synthase [Gemmataceae bacterium]MDW8265525.1 7-cyano-7-deazaguanine synthase [Gemmataceae bacterium]